MIPMYNHKRFSEIFETEQSFIEDEIASHYPTSLTEDEKKMIFWLLYAEYGQSVITNESVTQFKARLYSTIWKYAPELIKKQEIQKRLRELTENNGLLDGAKAINNAALNPEDIGTGTQSLEEINFINEQRTTNYKKNRLEAYAELWSMLDSNLTNEFLSKFKTLFLLVVRPQRTYIYEDEEEI